MRTIKLGVKYRNYLVITMNCEYMVYVHLKCVSSSKFVCSCSQFADTVTGIFNRKAVEGSVEKIKKLIIYFFKSI